MNSPDAMTHRQRLESLSGRLLVLFVALLSSTVVSTALPKIIGALNGSQTQYTWAARWPSRPSAARCSAA